MCGFCGAAWNHGSVAPDDAELTRMTRVLQHRGPDEQRTWFAGGGVPSAALGHRRLSIIDVENSHQPLTATDGRVTVAFNGEIYNYRELRDMLLARGHRFRTAGDTETIVHLYEEFGDECVAHLRGMFAFAVWDARERRLLLARDRMGQKPLYYRTEPHRILFGSELKALLQVNGAPRKVDPRSLDLFLTYQYVPHPHCILQGYCQLPPGHIASWRDGRFESHAYWRPPFEEPASQRAPADWEDELREVLTESVRLRMRADVPLGAFLSGGVDSTIVTGLMARISEQPVRTFAIGFSEPRFDERSFARTAATFHKTDHTELVVRPSAMDILPKLVWHYDEPFGDSSAIPSMRLAELTRQHVKVALSGDGGDELFLGYDRYRAVRLASYADRLPQPIRQLLGLGGLLPGSVQPRTARRRVKRLLAGLRLDPAQRYLAWISIFGRQQRRELYTQRLRQQLGEFNADQFLLALYGSTGPADFVSRTAFVDTLSYLPCDILTKVDRASMAYGLEARSPLLDHHVVELAVRMPRNVKQSLRTSKRILKRTFSDLLPPSVSQRPKMGFGVPIDAWFRSELRDLLYDVVLSKQAIERGHFDEAALTRLVHEHATGTADHASRLWSLLVLELWQRHFLDGPAPDAPPVIS